MGLKIFKVVTSLGSPQDGAASWRAELASRAGEPSDDERWHRELASRAGEPSDEERWHSELASNLRTMTAPPVGNSDNTMALGVAE